MLALGTVWIGSYKVVCTTPVFTLDANDPKVLELPYFEVLVTREENGASYYVHLMRDKLIPGLDLTERNPLFHPKNKEKLTVEEQEFRDEFHSYQHRKDYAMPMWKLSQRHIDELFDNLLRKETA